MPKTRNDLVERALRSLGIPPPKPESGDGTPKTRAELVERSLRNLGLSPPEPSNDELGPKTRDDLVARALRNLGVLPPKPTDPDATPKTRAELVERGLRNLGISPPISTGPGAPPKTRNSLIERALKNLGVLPAGQSASSEDYQSVSVLIEPLLEDLAARGIVHIEDPDEIDDRYFLPLAECLSYRASPEFGAALDPARLGPDGRPKAEDELVRTVRAEAMAALIDPLLEDLASRGLLLLDDPEEIPDKYFLPLAECLSYRASPEWGLKLDPARLSQDGRPKAEEELGQIEKASAMEALIDPVLEDLAARGLLHLADPDEIPDKYFLPLAESLSYRASPEWGLALDPARLLPNGRPKAEEELSQIEKAEAMDALVDPVLEDLAVRGLVYIADPDEIPDKLFLPISECLSYRASPEWGIPLDPARLRPDGRPKAEDELSRIEKYDAMDSLVDPLIDELAERRVVTIENVESIPDKFFLPLSDCLAYVAAPDWGLTLDQTRLRSDGRPKGEDELRRMTAHGPTYEPLRVEYF